MAEQIIILIPYFNDEEPLNLLLSELKLLFSKLSGTKFSILAVNDGSFENTPLVPPSGVSLQVLHLNRNIGHQKAIAVGLAFIKEKIPCDYVLVMDADGQDSPNDAYHLIMESKNNPGKIIVAQRNSRTEGNRFRLFYRLYKFAFRILTGQKIAFGNFLVIPKSILDQLVFYSEIWSHLAGGIIKSNLPYTSIPINRSNRYTGKSKMTFQSLLLHGMGAISVFIEVIASRLLLFSLLLIGFSLLTILITIGIKYFTELAIPGWTTSVLSAMLIILLQSFLLSLFTIFLYLSSQSQRKFIPAKHYEDYTGPVETIQ